jgi:hypothetical protein
MKNNNGIKQNSIYFIFVLIAIEIAQYFIITERGFLGGDFRMSMPVDSSLLISLVISISIWMLTYVIFKATKEDGHTRVNIPVTNIVLILFIFNFIVTVLGNVGSVLSENKSPISILTTLIPINYLILINAQVPNLNKKFIIAALILVIIDLYRLLLGAILKLGYIIVMRVNRKQLLAIVMALPLTLFPIQALVTYKFETRGMPLDDVEDVVVDVVTARIATLSTVHFIASNASELADYCHRSDYSSPWIAAGLSVIPKSIFGLEYVKTYNNCIIEYHLGRSVQDSSVNSPWLMTLYVEAISGFINFISYLILTGGILCAIIKISNFLFGASGDLFKLWVIFEFMWTGNILHLTIPLYFLIVILFYYFMKKHHSISSPNPLTSKEKNESLA